MCTSRQPCLMTHHWRASPGLRKPFPMLDSSPGGRTATGTSGWCSESEPLRADNRG